MQRLPQWLVRGLTVLGLVAVLPVLLGFERVMLGPVDSACKTVIINAKGPGNATITVDATVGGVTVLDALTTRCGAIIQNEAGAGDMRCASGTLAPTTTVGEG